MSPATIITLLALLGLALLTAGVFLLAGLPCALIEVGSLLIVYSWALARG